MPLVTTSGAVVGAKDENWACISEALQLGRRGLPGGDTLLKLIARKRKFVATRREVLTVEQIVKMAKIHEDHFGQDRRRYSHDLAGRRYGFAQGAAWTAGRFLIGENTEEVTMTHVFAAARCLTSRAQYAPKIGD